MITDIGKNLIICLIDMTRANCKIEIKIQKTVQNIKVQH